MSIVNTILHPETDNTVDLYPKTSTGQVDGFLDKTYPVGAIYMSTDSTSPASLFGGTWTAISDGFLVSAGYDSITAGATGGSKDAIVVSHSHNLYNGGQINGNEGNKLIQAYASGETLSGYKITTGGYVTEPATKITVSGAATQSSGISGTGKNMPPYLAVYMWKRVA